MCAGTLIVQIWISLELVSKNLQYLMEHSDISVTMNVYIHLKLEEAKRELKRVKV